MKIKTIFLILLSLFILTEGLFAESKKKDTPKTKIEDYTYEELEKLFVPTGKQYPALTGDVPVYFDVFVKNQPPKFKTEQIGILTISFVVDITKTIIDPNSTEIYQRLKDLAKAKGANVIRVSNGTLKQMGGGYKRIFDISYEFGKLIEDK